MSNPWNVNTLLDYMAEVSPDMGEDNEGQIILYTGLKAKDAYTLVVMDTGEELSGNNKSKN